MMKVLAGSNSPQRWMGVLSRLYPSNQLGLPWNSLSVLLSLSFSFYSSLFNTERWDAGCLCSYLQLYNPSFELCHCGVMVIKNGIHFEELFNAAAHCALYIHSF